MSRLVPTLVMLLAGACQAAELVERNVVVISIDGLPASYLDDPRASLPVIRELARAGVVAEGGMRVSNPSVTWPNHTTMMTGVHPDRHGVLFNGALHRDGPGKPVRVEPASGQGDLVRVPLLFDILHQAGRSSAAINWPCTRDSMSIGDNFPDVSNMLDFTTPRLKAALEEAGHLAPFEEGGGVARDIVWTEAARWVIRERGPRLLALHLLNLDSTHHRHGPDTAPGFEAAALADTRIGQVLDALDEAGLRERTAVFVVADHGFAAVTKSIRPNAALRRLGFLQADGDRIVAAKVQVIPEGGIGMVYLNEPGTADQDGEAVRRLFADVEGVEAILGPDDFARHHLPRPEDNDRMADLILVAADGYAISGSAEGDAEVVPNPGTTGSHGYLATEPKMNAIFVASGAGIKAGADLGTIDNIDLAPTVARLLGVPLEQAAGRVLGEILDTKD